MLDCPTHALKITQVFKHCVTDLGEVPDTVVIETLHRGASSAARRPSNSRPLVGRAFCTANPSFSFLSFLFFVDFFCFYYFCRWCCFAILLRPGPDTHLVNELQHSRRNKEVGRLQCVETAEQWPALCELCFFFFFCFSDLNTM